jgi:hypothetical protein
MRWPESAERQSIETSSSGHSRIRLGAQVDWRRARRAVGAEWSATGVTGSEDATQFEVLRPAAPAAIAAEDHFRVAVRSFAVLDRISSSGPVRLSSWVVPHVRVSERAELARRVERCMTLRAPAIGDDLRLFVRHEHGSCLLSTTSASILNATMDSQAKGA